MHRNSNKFSCLAESKYNLWYRHSGQPEIDALPFSYENQYMSFDEIQADIGEEHITHMITSDDVVPSLSAIAPLITHLRITAIRDSVQLDRYTC